MPKLTPEKRAELRDANPDAFVLRTSVAPGLDFVFKPVPLAAFDAFLSAVNGDDATAKVYAHRTLAADCVLFPSRDELLAFGREKPGAVHALGDELAKRAGLRAEVVSDAL